MNTTYYQKATGQAAETAACQYLQNQGLTLITKNFSSKLGEIDLIMKEKQTVVFVEVRLRNVNNFATGLESVTRSKQQKIIKTATTYLLKENLWNKTLCRFDVIGVTPLQNECFHFDWIKNAFY